MSTKNPLRYWDPKKRTRRKPPFEYEGYIQHLTLWTFYFESYYPTDNIFNLVWYYLWNMDLREMTVLILDLGITADQVKYYGDDRFESILDLVCRKASSEPDSFIFFLECFSLRGRLQARQFDIILYYSEFRNVDGKEFWDLIELSIYYDPTNIRLSQYRVDAIHAYQAFKKRESLIIIKRNIQNWLYKPLCADNTMGIVPRLGIKKIGAE